MSAAKRGCRHHTQHATPHPTRAWRRAAGGITVAAALAASLLSPAAFAEKADRDKPINVEADRMQYDDLKQINVFTGNVVLTKGTIIIRGDRVVVRQDPEGFQYGTAYGSPAKLASFRQKREGVDQYVEGYGVQIDYDGKTEIVTLDQKALMKKLEKERVTDEVQGNRIVYQSLNEFFTVESGGSAASSTNPTGRVRVILQPKNEGAPPPPGTPPASITIRPDPTLSSPSSGPATEDSAPATPRRPATGTQR